MRTYIDRAIRMVTPLSTLLLVAAASGQPASWDLRLTTVPTPQSPSATVELWARFDPSDHAFAASRLDILATDGAFSNPQTILGGPGKSPGALHGATVSGIVVGQSHFPPTITADPSSPILVWRATWTTRDFSPRTVQFTTATKRFDTYPASNSPRAESRLQFLTEGLADVGITSCYADCDASTGPGTLDIFDFLCFQNRYDAGDPYACDCDTGTGPGVCDIFDFLCFQNAYAAGCASLCERPPLMACRIDTDTVLLLDACTGSVIDPEFIVGGPVGMRVATEALRVEAPGGPEVWVSDQIADRIFRFDLNGAHLGTITGGLDDINGMGVTALGTVWVTNAGTNNGAPGDGVVIFDPDGTRLGFFPAENPFDALAYNGNMLVTNIQQEDIDIYSHKGVLLGRFLDSCKPCPGEIDFPGQMSIKANGNLLVAGFSPPVGIFEYDPSGTQVDYIATGGPGVRGVHELGNGDLLYTDAEGVHRWSNGQSTLVAPGSFRFITPLGP